MRSGKENIIKLLPVLTGALLPFLSVPCAAALPEYLTEWGSRGAGAGHFMLPVAVAVDSRGDVYVGDAETCRIQKFDPAGRFVMGWGSEGSGPGRFGRVLGLAVDAADRIYVVDAIEGAIQVFDASGNFLRMWGSASDTPLGGEFFWASNIAVADDGSSYVTDQGTVSGIYGHDVQRFDAAGGFLLKWGLHGAGTGELYHPFGIALDDAGHVYVADSVNQRIQKFDGAGNFLLAWGTPGSGPGQFSRPFGMDFDRSSGTLYVADGFNDRVQIFDRAGHYEGAIGGVRGAAAGQMDTPFAVAADGKGNVYVADTLNWRIQKFGRPVREAVIDVRPGANNKVNLRSNGLVTVAVLTTDDLDAGDVDPQSLALGPAGARIVHAGGHFQDVDGDGDLDLVLHFRIREIGIACGDVSVTLTGATWNGEKFEGSDSIATEGC